MIIDRNWNRYEQKFNVSYVDKDGKRQMFSKYLHHWKTYEYNKDGEYETWNGKKCSKVFKNTDPNAPVSFSPSEFDQLELLYELPKDILKELHATYTPKPYAWDIEVEESKAFPNPMLAAQKITAFSLVGPDLSCCAFGVGEEMTDERKQMMEDRYIDWIRHNDFASKILGDKKPKVICKAFPTEKLMIRYWMSNILPKICCVIGWNSYNFDWTYLVNRCKRLFGEGETNKMLRRISPTGELCNIRYEVAPNRHENFTSPRHFINADYMLLCKQYDYVLRPYESYSLNWVAEHAVGGKKIEYEGSLQQLYETDPDKYYFYNVIDSLLVMLIHYRLKCIESPCAVSSLTLVPYQTAQGQIALTVANVFEQFYNQNRHVVWDYDAVTRIKQDYEGAFVGAVPGKWLWTVCYDFKSLYPSQIQTCNFSFENIIDNLVGPDSLGRYTPVLWTQAQLDEFRRDKNYFVSENGNVYRNDKDYTFKKMQAYLMLGRDKYKYLGQKIDREIIFNIGRLLHGAKDECIPFSKQIQDFLAEEYPSYDIYKMTEDELKSFKEEVSIKRDEFSLLEQAFKVSMNAAYGACANPGFYFFDPRIAADITAECRKLTKSMWDRYELFYKKDIWERKDLWEKFGFELDESKKDYISNCVISCYSDTDSVYVTFGPLFKCFTPETRKKYHSSISKRDWIQKFNDEFMNQQNGIWLDEMYSARNGHNVHVFEMEAINLAQIVLAKKKYVKAVMINKGKVYDTPKVSGTGVEIIKSTTPALCRTILTDLIHKLLFEDIEDKEEYIMSFNEKLQDYKKDFYRADYESISQSVGVGDYEKFVIDDETCLKLRPSCPVSVQSIARFNYMAHKNGDDDKKTYSGKIKYYNIRLGARKDNIGYFGYPSGNLPKWRPNIDMQTQWSKNVIDPINRFLEVLDIPTADASGFIQNTLF